MPDTSIRRGLRVLTASLATAFAMSTTRVACALAIAAPGRRPPPPKPDAGISDGAVVAIVVVAFVVFFLFVLVAIIRAASRTSGQAPAAAGGFFGGNRGPSGVPGRAFVLSASQNAVGVTVRGQRFQRRTMTLDIELSGAAPYQVSGDFLVPRGFVDAIPGSLLDVVVDPRNPQSVTVLGPGGFTGPWLRTGPPQLY